MIKKLFLVLLFAFSYLLSATFVYGKDFSSFYKTTYEFDKQGQAFVTQEISLVNETPDLYVSEYSLSLTGGKIESVEAYDKIGPLKVRSENTKETTTVFLNFNEKVAGKGKILSFILKYKVVGLAEKKGNLWEISVPYIANSQNIDDIQFHLKVPVVLGKIGSINPRPSSLKTSGDFHLLDFTKSDLSSYGIHAVFGHYQTFDFKIFYELNNPSTEVKTEKIALPPDTNYQEIYYENLTPKPKNVETDADGNWLALYEIPSSSKIHIEAVGKAVIFSQPQKKLPVKPINIDLYTQAEKYWETGNPEIIALAQKLKTQKNIYDYVVKTLSYDYDQIDSKITRKGAVFTLANPSKVLCSEFTDLFVALARAVGIPAREVEGYAYNDNPKINNLSSGSDILHSWPEFYDRQKNEWLMIDPTFANTSGGLDFFNQFDMTHFTFVIHGQKSDFPYPAGSFKENFSDKQIFVNFGQDFVKTDSPALSVENVLPKSLFTLKATSVYFEIKNSSGYAVNNKKLSLANSGDIFPKEWQIETIPPFGSIKIVTSFKPKEMFSDYALKSSLAVGDNTIFFNQNVVSSLLRLLIIATVGISIIIISILISIRKQKND